MVYCTWVNSQSSQKNVSPRSMCLLPSPRCLTHLPFRERREHRVFQLLLQMIPGLEERLVEGSEENVIHVAELVCFLLATCLERLMQFTYPDSERRFQRQI